VVHEGEAWGQKGGQAGARGRKVPRFSPLRPRFNGLGGPGSVMFRNNTSDTSCLSPCVTLPLGCEWGPGRAGEESRVAAVRGASGSGPARPESGSRRGGGIVCHAAPPPLGGRRERGRPADPPLPAHPSPAPGPRGAESEEFTFVLLGVGAHEPSVSGARGGAWSRVGWGEKSGKP
jgi:hypothetical protein